MSQKSNLKYVENSNLELGYTIIDNYIFREHDMSSSTKWIYAMMKHFPPEWHFTETGLTKLIHEGRRVVDKAIKELTEKGYLKKERVRSEDGTGFGGYYYTLYAKPIIDSTKVENNNAHDVVSQNVRVQNVQVQNVQELSNNKLITNISNTNKYINIPIGLDNVYTNKENTRANNNTITHECETYVNSIYNNIEPEPSNLAEEDSHKSLLNAKQTKKYKQLGGISYRSYSNQELQDYMSKLVDCILHTKLDQKKYGKYINDHYATEINKTFSYYYAKYWETYGMRHIIPKMPTMIRCVENFLEPPTSRMNGYDIRDFESYKPMIDKHLDGSFGWNTKTEKDVDLTLQHFMTGEIRENLLMRVHHLV